MVNRYIKMRSTSSAMISVDFSDGLTFSPPPSPPPPHLEDALRHPRTDAEARPRCHFSRQEEQAAGVEKFGVILSRTSSSSISHSFAASYERRNRGINGASAGGGVHPAVRRAFSMRKLAPSPPEGYCRIHDSIVSLAVADVVQGDFTEEHVSGKQMKTTTKEGKVLRACRRLFGF